ncbi:hypothetical protein ULMS_14890 [Patiriisocius marinistellae]|uniref:Sulfotransferase family protein n=1 Tax=Patiriisocius marinistellae TaxID=2494560 RepID=A0A5J4G1R8_9FLAO|nr:sulfotransferase family 2 domain-containing protein [Patiriisocius marinistellae]GEQ85981.1 hypothetical protein ULMS_14890 [Patiriisocius marinistellae]
MLILDELKVIFIHVHRTGGSTISNILRERKLVNTNNVLPQHTNAKNDDTSILEKHHDYYTIGCTRNPWDRILSWYLLLHFNDLKSIEKERTRLEDFIEQDIAIDLSINYFHYNTLDYLSNKEDSLIANKIFRFENIENDIREFLLQYNIYFQKIPIINKTFKKDYKNYYTDKARELIAQKCSKDIQYFNYEF